MGKTVLSFGQLVGRGSRLSEMLICCPDLALTELAASENSALSKKSKLMDAKVVPGGDGGLDSNDDIFSASSEPVLF